MYIVAEYLFLENFLINFAILHITRIITRTKGCNKRILIASLIAALYPFVLFIPSLIFLTNFFVKILISIIIVRIAYNTKSIRLYMKQLIGFFLVSFIYAGASIGVYYFFQSYSNSFSKLNGFSRNFSVRYLILGIVLAVILIKNIFEYYNEKVTREKELYEVTIYYYNKAISLVALLDTGNSLVEPLTKLPVFIVEYEVIKELIPNDLRHIYDNHEEGNLSKIQILLEDLKEETHIRIIPYKSIGTKNGFLIGFKPDYIELIKDSKTIINDNLIIAIFNGKLSTDDQFKGLLSLEILDRGKIYVEKNST